MLVGRDSEVSASSENLSALEFGIEPEVESMV